MAELEEIANSQSQGPQGSGQAGGVQVAAQAAGDQEGEHREVRNQRQEQELRHPLSYLEQHSGFQVCRMKP